MEEALPSFQNRPILGHIIQKDDGTYDFSSHDMEIIDDPWNEGEKRIKYLEQSIGVIPESCNAHLEYDKEKDKTYVVVNGWIYEDYGNGAAEIIKEKGSIKVSVELGVKKFSYNAEEKQLEIEEFIFLGVTALGEDIGEGMLGSNMIADFSNTQNNQEGGNGDMTLEDLLNKYNVSLEELSFNVEGVEPKKLEELFKKAFEEGNDTDTETETDSSEVTDTTEENETNESDPDPDIEDPDTDDEEQTDDVEDDDKEESEETSKASNTDDEIVRKRQYSVSIGAKNYNFAVSLDEVIYALETLVNSAYSESDNTYYCVKVYDKYVVMVDCWTGKAYKQNYKIRNGSYSLTGDRIEVYARYLTKEEEQALDEMRTNYSSMEEELQQYKTAEEDSEKQALVASDEYSLIQDSEEYQEIIDNIDSYSLQTLKAACDELLLKYVKSNGAFAQISQAKTKKKIRTGARKEESYSPYGTLFSEYE